MRIFENEIDFDFADADDLEKFEVAYPKAQKELESVKWNEEKSSVSVRKFCDIIFNFCDEVFGEGTAEKIFKGKRNYQKCLEFFREIVNAKEKQDVEIDESLEYLNKYSPDRIKRS